MASRGCIRDRLNPPEALEATEITEALDPVAKYRVQEAVQKWNNRLRQMINKAAELSLTDSKRKPLKVTVGVVDGFPPGVPSSTATSRRLAMCRESGFFLWR